MNPDTKQKQTKRETKPVCEICAEEYNKSTRLLVECPYCHFESCRSCCERYVLNENDVKCMSCNKEWTRKMIREIFTLVFINGSLREHKEKILFDKQRALMPATQPIIEGMLIAKEIDKKIRDVEKQISELHKQEVTLRREKVLALNRHSSNDRTAFVRKCPDGDCRGFLSSRWKCGVCDKWACPDCHVIKGFTQDEPHECKPDDLATAKLLDSDTKPCPKCRTSIFKIDGCFASNTQITLYDKSVIMSHNICVGHVLMGDDGTPRNVIRTLTGTDEMYTVHQMNGMSYTVNSQHTLVVRMPNSPHIREIRIQEFMNLEEEERVLWQGYTTEGLLSDLQIVPQGRGIYYGWEVDGNHRFVLKDNTVVRNCDQMWCTQCHTGFSWRTGRLETQIHNPHYNEWLRRTGGGEIPRNPLDVQCGRELNYHLLERFRLAMLAYTTIPYVRDIMKRIQGLIRNGMEIRQYDRIDMERNYNQKHQELRISYLLKRITEEEMRIELQKDDKLCSRKREMNEVFLLLTNTICEILYRQVVHLENSRDEKPFCILTEVDHIINYANECFADISHTYSCAKLVILPDLTRLRGKSAVDYLRTKAAQEQEKQEENLTNSFVV